MRRYIFLRLLLIAPTLFGIMLLNFLIVQLAPGGPVEQTLAKLTQQYSDVTERFTGAGAQEVLSHHASSPAHQVHGGRESSQYRGAQGVDPALIAELEALYGFDQPAHVRFWDMMWRYLQFDFGESFYRDVGVVELVKERLPVSISLGLWTTLLAYLVSIPLGIRKAVRDGSSFDMWSSGVIVVGYAIPSFLFAVLLVVLFAGGSMWDIFPLRGLVSDGWEQMSWSEKVVDYIWHMTLPVLSMAIGGFATLTLLCKNSFLEEIRKQYVLTAMAKGCSEKRVLYGHVFRNAMLIVIAGFPGAFLGILFTGSLLIEVIFSLNGLGLLGFEAALSRDYPVLYSSLYVFTLLGLVVSLLGDLMYHLVDPRIDFGTRTL